MNLLIHNYSKLLVIETFLFHFSIKCLRKNTNFSVFNILLCKIFYNFFPCLNSLIYFCSQIAMFIGKKISLIVFKKNYEKSVYFILPAKFSR